MKKQRTFSIEFKRQLVEELISGVSTSAQVCRSHELSSGLLYYWKRQYAKGRFGGTGHRETVLEDRIAQLEQLLGKSYLEIEFLKKALQRTLAQSKKSGSSLPTTELCSKPSRGGANS